jgi:hypothetical protein
MRPAYSPPLFALPTLPADCDFGTRIECPFCTWASAASSPSYLAAEGKVVARLLAHMDHAHAEMASLVAPESLDAPQAA